MAIINRPAVFNSRNGKGGSPLSEMTRFGDPQLGSEVVGYSMTANRAEVELDLRTKRFTARRLTSSDYAEVRRVMSANRDRLLPSGQSAGSDGFLSEDEFAEEVESLDRLWAMDQRYEWGWFQGDELIARTGLWGVLRGTVQSAFGAGWVAESVAKSGAGKETWAGTMQFAFDVLELHRVEQPTLTDNLPMLHLQAEVLGLSDEGVIPNYMMVNGVWRDHRKFVLTAEEWEQRREEWLRD